MFQAYGQLFGCERRPDRVLSFTYGLSLKRLDEQCSISVERLSFELVCTPVCSALHLFGSVVHDLEVPSCKNEGWDGVAICAPSSSFFRLQFARIVSSINAAVKVFFILRSDSAAVLLEEQLVLHGLASVLVHFWWHGILSFA